MRGSFKSGKGRRLGRVFIHIEDSKKKRLTINSNVPNSVVGYHIKKQASVDLLKGNVFGANF